MKQPRHHRFTDNIEKMIRSGACAPGSRLPSVREVMAQYGLSAGTVQNGYDHLVALGLVDNQPRSGYYVSHRVAAAAPPAAPVVRDAAFSRRLQHTTSQYTGRHSPAEFNVAAPDDLLIPQKLLLRTLQETIREQGAGLLRYYPPMGAAALRQHISRHAAQYRTRIHADELIITDGALQALYIALASVCRPGDVVAVESPCVFSVLEVLKVLRLKVVEIPVPFSLHFLEQACATLPLRAILVTPNFHNPTGALLADEQKQQLVALAEQFDIPVIENDVYGDLHFGGQRPCTLKTFDSSGRVLTISSFSKTLAPGIRLGWLSPGRYYQQAEQVRFSLGSSASPVYQAVLTKLFETGGYQRHVRLLRTQLAQHAARTQQLLAAAFPTGTAVTTPHGGYSLWVQMPAGTDMARFYRHCDAAGVKFTPGHIFSFSGDYSRHFRLVFAAAYTPAREAAIAAAGQLYH